MKITFKNWAVLLSCFTLVSGCETGGINQPASPGPETGDNSNRKPVSDGLPTYAQNQAVTLLKPYSITIDKCYWADEFGFSKKPSAKFLVVEFSIKNLSQSADTWGARHPLIFMLKNARGSEYASVGQDVNVEDLTAKP